jgi:hypothetical protein
VKHLSIADEHGDVSLDRIADSFPHLTKLEFYSNAGYSGSLQDLRSLEEVIVWDYQLDKESGSREHIFPTDSASSLMKLNLSYVYGPPQNIYNSQLISAFTNLSSFTILPLSEDLCDSIITANFTHLRTFVTVVRNESEISIGAIMKLLKSRTLSKLQTLRLLVEPFIEKFNDGYFDIIKTITSSLSSTLEELQLTMGINTAWANEFSSLRKLRDFYWRTMDQEFCDSNDPLDTPLDGSVDIFETSPEEMSDIFAARMEYAFRDFKEVPEYDIRILDDDHYEQWDELC